MSRKTYSGNIVVARILRAKSNLLELYTQADYEVPAVEAIREFLLPFEDILEEEGYYLCQCGHLHKKGETSCH